jgi:acetate kinase
MTEHLVLALNAGSSSIKLGLYEMAGAGAGARRIGRGQVDLHAVPVVLALDVRGRRKVCTLDAAVTESLEEVVDAALAVLQAHDALRGLRLAAHRIVHGGTRFRGAVCINEAVVAELAVLTPLAPLHQPHCLRLVRAMARLRPDLPQTASFDTAFHHTQDPLVRRFAIPRELHQEGIQRYGFHGLSYAWIARVLAERHPGVAAGRVVAAHLGSGASLCALSAGRSVDSSMGFSTLDGIPMATRCGAIDPGVLLYLLRRGMSLKDLEDLLYHRSGLLGLSGASADVRVLRSRDDDASREALQLLAMRCAGEAARLPATMGGLDALVFTAGIGEHDAVLRSDIAARLEWIGAAVDDRANADHAEIISARHSRVHLLVIPADEEQIIAEEAVRLIEART